jgi:hypothetical protein
MKFVIAPSILVPALSLTEVRSDKLSHPEEERTKDRHDDSPFDWSRFLATVVKRYPSTTSQERQQQQPLGNQGNDLAAGSRQRHHRELVSVVHNNNNNHHNNKNCDPLSNDPDIGILSCDIGYECVMVDRPHESTVRGICTPLTTATATAATTTTTTSRDLQEEELVSCFLCNPGSKVTSENYGTVLNNGATCGDIAYATYYNTTVGISYSDCLSVSELAQESGCCSPVSMTLNYNCSICGDVALFYADGVFPLFDGSIIPCADIPLDLNDTECELYSSYYATHCCAPEIDASRVPTSAPQQGGSDADPPATAPTNTMADTAARSTHFLWSMTSTLVSTMGLMWLARQIVL